MLQLNLLWITAAVAALGCSLTNSFDDVRQDPVASGGAGGGSRDDGGGASGGADSSAGGGIPDASAGGSGGVQDAGGEAAVLDAASGGADGAPADAGSGGMPDDDAGPFTSGGPNGVIVAYNEDDKELVVLSPSNGSVVSREAMNPVTAIVHDGAEELWFIFEREAVLDETQTLHVRELDTTNGRWRELSTAEVPPPATPIANGALPNKLVYLSLPMPTSSQDDYGFTVLNTSDPTDVAPIAPAVRTLPAGGKIGLLVNRQGPTFNVVIQGDCGATSCDVGLLRYLVNANNVIADAAGVVKVGEVSQTGGAPGLTFDITQGADILVLPPTELPDLPDGGSTTGCVRNGPYAEGQVVRLDPSNHGVTQGPFRFDIAGRRIAGAAYDYCSGTVVFNTLFEDQALFAVPTVATGTASRSCAGSGGGDLRYEPFTRSMIRNSFGTLQAYALGGERGMPVLDQRIFSPGFRVDVFAVRQPFPAQPCD